MTKWEYRAVSLRGCMMGLSSKGDLRSEAQIRRAMNAGPELERRLNDLGAEGWEAFSGPIEGGWFIFKRPAPGGEG